MLDAEQTSKLADGLARLARAVDEHGEALHSVDVLGTDTMHQRALDAQAAVAETAFDVLAGWKASLPREVLPDG